MFQGQPLKKVKDFYNGKKIKDGIKDGFYKSMEKELLLNLS